MVDIRDTLSQRGQKYGAFKDNAKVAQKLKRIWQTSDGYRRVSCEPVKNDDVCPTAHVVNEGMEMILHKVARICNGDPVYVDSWVDIAGYAQLVVDFLQSTQKQEVTWSDRPLETSENDEAAMLLQRVKKEREAAEVAKRNEEFRRKQENRL